MITLIESDLKKLPEMNRKRCDKCNKMITRRHNICNICKGNLQCKKDTCLNCKKYFEEWYFKQECLITDDD